MTCWEKRKEAGFNQSRVTEEVRGMEGRGVEAERRPRKYSQDPPRDSPGLSPVPVQGGDGVLLNLVQSYRPELEPRFHPWVPLGKYPSPL